MIRGDGLPLIRMDQSKIYITKSRIAEIEEEVRNLKVHGRKDIAARIAEARAQGDLSENAEYDAAREEQGLLELRIRKLEGILQRRETQKEMGGRLHAIRCVAHQPPRRDRRAHCVGRERQDARRRASLGTPFAIETLALIEQREGEGPAISRLACDPLGRRPRRLLLPWRDFQIRVGGPS